MSRLTKAIFIGAFVPIVLLSAQITTFGQSTQYETPDQEFKQAIALQEIGDYYKSYELLLDLSIKGYSKAYAPLSFLMLNGIMQDCKQVKTFAFSAILAKECEGFNVMASIAKTGVCSKGGKKDLAKAQRYLDKASNCKRLKN